MVDRKVLEEKFLSHGLTDFKWIDPEKTKNNSSFHKEKQ